MGPHSSGPSEAQGVLRGSDDVGGFVLASTSLVPGPCGSGSGSSALPSTLSRSQTAAFPSSSSQALQAVASLLLLLLTDEHITIRNKQGATDLRTTGFLK